MSRAAPLLATMGEAYGPLRPRLDGPFAWRPAPGCWTIFRDPSGRWRHDHAVPDPTRRR